MKVLASAGGDCGSCLGARALRRRRLCLTTSCALLLSLVLSGCFQVKAWHADRIARETCAQGINVKVVQPSENEADARIDAACLQAREAAISAHNSADTALASETAYGPGILLGAVDVVVTTLSGYWWWGS
jgi:hypothetical protein